MDESEKLLAFLNIEISLVQELEQITEIEAQHLENLKNWNDNALKKEAEFS